LTPAKPITPHNGFILVATLVAIAIITIAAAWFASQIDGLRESASRMQTWASAERETFSVREGLMYAAAIGIREEGGVSVRASAGSPTNNVAEPRDRLMAATDGRAYRLADSLTIRIQDERGLIGINTADDAWLTRLLSQIGVPLEQQPRLMDGLKDYIDDDNLRRLNGAERAEYAQRNLPPPANDFLRAREELANVIAWQPLLTNLRRADERNGTVLSEQFLNLFSVSRHFGVNINSAPAAVLATIPGIDPSKVPLLIDQRRAKPFVSFGELAPFTNAPLDSDLTGFVGANDWRITLEKADLPFLLECQLTMTPGDRERPVRAKYCVRRPLLTSPSGQVAVPLTAIAIRRAVDAASAAERSAESSAPALQPATPSEISRTLFATSALRSRSSNGNANTEQVAPAPAWLASLIEPGRAPFVAERR
jgi:general secretion pathway protein K